MKALSFSEVQDLALAIFYEIAKADIVGPLGINTSYTLEIPGANPFFTDRAVDGLEERGFLAHRVEPWRRTHRITARGLSYYERQIEHSGSFLNKARRKLRFYFTREDRQTKDGVHVTHVITCGLETLNKDKDQIELTDGPSPSAALIAAGVVEVESLQERSKAEISSQSPWGNSWGRSKSAEGNSDANTHRVGALSTTSDGSIVVNQSALPNAPASDRVVSLDHNSATYRDAVSTLDRTIKAFKDDHRLDNELGREKLALEKILEGGRELLNDSKVRIQAVIDFIVRPLQIIVSRYEHSLVAALATTALETIVKLFS